MQGAALKDAFSFGFCFALLTFGCYLEEDWPEIFESNLPIFCGALHGALFLNDGDPLGGETGHLIV